MEIEKNNFPQNSSKRQIKGETYLVDNVISINNFI